ncbi:MAG: CDP-2,3-bis-(O-geranylgeranyl)-sn-glycerol synthase [Nanoarchaeota archaeon]|nr:CDP-2,3-bis-(O-geranylgeranyl)-sn-glycerol synthase [Nanoarchaeota archaeon]
MGLILLILQSIYFIVPAYFANMAPVIAKKLKILQEVNKPIDMNTKFDDGKPIFGKHKTYRGFIVAIIMGIIFAYLQMFLYRFSFFRSISITDYSSALSLGFLLGFGAITGDLMKSFFKRRLNIKSGKKFIPFDQADFVLGAYIFILPFYSRIITWPLFLSSIIASFFLHIIVNHISFYLGIRKEKW